MTKLSDEKQGFPANIGMPAGSPGLPCKPSLFPAYLILCGKSPEEITNRRLCIEVKEAMAI